MTYATTPTRSRGLTLVGIEPAREWRSALSCADRKANSGAIKLPQVSSTWAGTCRHAAYRMAARGSTTVYVARRSVHGDRCTLHVGSSITVANARDDPVKAVETIYEPH